MAVWKKVETVDNIGPNCVSQTVALVSVQLEKVG